MIEKIGFMQGRLSPLVNGRIQAFPWQDWEKEFAIAEVNNFHMMEWTLDQEKLNENPLIAKKGQDEIRAISKKYKIKIPSVTGDCFMQSPFWKEKGRERLNLELDFIKIIEACSDLKINLLIIPLVDNGRLENSQQEDGLVLFLEKQTSFLLKKNVRIAFESDYSPYELARFIDRLSPNSFGINYDIGNSAALGFDPKIELFEYGSRVFNVHLKDRLLGGSTVPLGLGNADFITAFSLLYELKYTGNLILQTARAIDDDHIKTLCVYRDIVINWINYIEA